MVNTQEERHGIQNLFRGGVDVPHRLGDRTVARDPRQSPHITAGRPQASQERMSQAIENERPDLAVFHGFLEWLLERRWFDVPAHRFRRPYPTFFWSGGSCPFALKDGAHPPESLAEHDGS